MKISRITNCLIGSAVLLASLSPARAAGKINVVTATQDLAALGAEVGGDRIASSQPYWVPAAARLGIAVYQDDKTRRRVRVLRPAVCRSLLRCASSSSRLPGR